MEVVAGGGLGRFDGGFDRGKGFHAAAFCSGWGSQSMLQGGGFVGFEIRVGDG